MCNGAVRNTCIFRRYRVKRNVASTLALHVDHPRHIQIECLRATRPSCIWHGLATSQEMIGISRIISIRALEAEQLSSKKNSSIITSSMVVHSENKKPFNNTVEKEKEEQT